MKNWNSAVLAVALGAATLGWVARPSVSASAQDAPPAVVPSAEHKFLERYVGTWDAVMEMASMDGSPAEKSKASATCKLTCGGLWLVTDFSGTFMGGPFTGHEVTGYDPITKKYQVSWFDSMSPTAFTGTGSFDAATTTLHNWMSGHDATGQPSEHHGTDVWSDADHRKWTMWMKGPDGSEFPAMTITYSRRK